MTPTPRLGAFVVLGSILSGCAQPEPELVEPTPGLFAFTGARLILGTQDAVIEDGVLVIRDGSITAVGTLDATEVPVDAALIDVSGKTIMPGMINAHGHVNNVRGLESDPAFYTEEHVERQLAVYARYGVTTVLSLGSGGEAGIAVRDRQTHSTEHARLYLSGPVVTGDSPEKAIGQVDAVADLGVDMIKIRVDDSLGATEKMSPEIYQAIINRAHARNLRVASHLYYLEDAKGLLNAGTDFIAHSIRDQPIDEELISLLLEHDICYCPTLMREVSTFVYETRPDWFDDPFFLKEVDPAVVHTLESIDYQEEVRSRPSTQVYKEALAMAQRNLKVLADRGVRIAMGTDSGPAARFRGDFEHGELKLMAEAGLSPMQILGSATNEAARCLQVDDKIGTLESGKWADFVVLGANPLENIHNTRSIESVWIGGRKIQD